MVWYSPSPEWRKSNPEWIEVLVRFGTGPSGWTYLGGVGLICGAGPIGLGLPQRGLGETGKSPNTTVKHHRVIVVCILVLYSIAIYIHRIKLLINLCMVASYQ